VRLWRMAAGSSGAWRKRAMVLKLVSRCGKRVSRQASVSAAPRRQPGSGVGRSSVNRASGTFRGASHRGGLLDQRGTWPATVHGRRAARAQIGMFTQRVRGGRRGGFLLGAARRGVAF